MFPADPVKGDLRACPYSTLQVIRINFCLLLKRTLCSVSRQYAIDHLIWLRNLPVVRLDVTLCGHAGNIHPGRGIAHLLGVSVKISGRRGFLSILWVGP